MHYLEVYQNGVWLDSCAGPWEDADDALEYAHDTLDKSGARWRVVFRA